jgi:hypothetical protein
MQKLFPTETMLNFMLKVKQFPKNKKRQATTVNKLQWQILENI